MYLKKFEIRWSDLDANRHVANTSYANLLIETRLAHLRDNGISQENFVDYGIGPVIFSEEFFYVKEIRPNEKITVSLELLGNTNDFKFVKFEHCIFNNENKLSLYNETFFGWINLLERKLVAPPDAVKKIVSALPKSIKYELLPERMNLKNPKIPFGKSL